MDKTYLLIKPLIEMLANSLDHSLTLSKKHNIDYEELKLMALTHDIYNFLNLH